MKKLVVVLGVLLVFLGAVAIIVPKLVDLNNYKGEIAEAVKKETGRDLIIDGDIELTLFPWIGAEIGKISLSNAPGFGDEPFLQLEKARIAVKLMPLLDKNVEVETVTVKGLNVNLWKNAKGTGNWEDLLGKKEAASTTPAAAIPLASLTVGGLAVEESNFNWRDDSKGLVASLRNITLKTGAVVIGEPLESMVSFDLESNKPNLKGNVRLETKVHFDESLKPFKLTATNIKTDMTFRNDSTGLVSTVRNVDLKMESLVRGEPIDVFLSLDLENNQPELNGNIALATRVFLKEDFSLAKFEGTDLQSNMTLKNSVEGSVTSVKNLALKSGTLVPGMPADLTATFLLEKSAPAISGNVDLKTRVDVNDDFSFIKFSGTDLKGNLNGVGVPGGVLALKMQTNAAANLKDKSVYLDQLVLSAYDLNINGQVKGTNLIANPALSGKITVNAFNPRTVLGFFGIPLPKTADPKAITHLGLITGFDVSKSGISLSKMWAKLDDSTIKGDAAIRNFTNPSITYDLDIDRIDFDRYTPPAEAAKAKTASAMESPFIGFLSLSPNNAYAEATSATQSPLLGLLALNVKGMLRIESAKVKGISMTNVVSGVQANDGLVNLNPMKAKLFKGTYDGNMRIDARKNVPSTEVSTTIKGMNIGQALKTFADKDFLDGSADICSDLTFTGLEAPEIKKSLSGKANFLFQNGTIKGFNIPTMIRRARATVNVAGSILSGSLNNVGKGDLSGLVGVVKGIGEMAQKPKGDVDEPMDFTEISGSATITKGLVVNKDLKMKSPLLRLQGEGNTNLATEEIDYLVKATVVGSLEGQGGKDELSGLTVPVYISGTHSKPEWKVDPAPIKDFLLRNRSNQNNTNTQPQQEPQQGQQQQKQNPIEQIAPPEIRKLLKQSPLGDIFR